MKRATVAPDRQGPRIRLSRNGPYLVRVDDLTNSKGERFNGSLGVALCRCGASNSKPFCDSSHIRIGFSDEPCPDLAWNAEGGQSECVNAASVRVSKNGPYEVSGFDQDTRNGNEGASHEHFCFCLCRCGASKNKPFCDGSHRTIGFRDDSN